MSRKRSKHVHGQAGIALLVALFALMLLSAIAMAMMFDANTETSMASNYREIQVAQMGAYSGLWEGRDRLRYDTSATSNMVLHYTSNLLTLPNDKPLSTAGNVIYIINPSSGETVAPWDYTNKYADTELCQENVLSLSGTAGVPCTGSSSLPSGSTWYTKIDDSSYGGSYQLANPLPFKWVRVQLKTDNATTYPVGSSSTGNLVCWDGQHEVPIPTGYSSSCGPKTGTINSITVTSPGTGYTSAPTVTISGGGGSGATATANVTTTNTGAVASVTVTNPGQNYGTAPTVTLSNGGGIGATAVAVIGTSGGQINSASLTSGSSTACWNSSPAPLYANIQNPGTGTGGQITVNTAVGTCLAGITISGTCTKNADFTATLTSSSGTGAVVEIKTIGSGAFKSGYPVVLSGGSGYSSGDTFTLTPAAGYSCSSLSISSPQFGYMVNTSNPFTINSGGTGYSNSSPPTITIANPGSGSGTGTGGSGTTTVSGGGGNPGQVIAVNVTYGGTGYTSAPTVTITPVTGDPGSGATATANLGTAGTVTSITVNSVGSGYTSNPTVTLSGGGGTGAAATANLTSGTYYGNVFLVTALGMSPAGARYMAQMEAVAPVRGMATTGALTFDGLTPYYNAPNSAFYSVKGEDAASCGSPVPDKPAVGVVSESDVAPLISALPSTNSANYTGANPAPDVENVANSLTATMKTPSGLEAFGAAISAAATSQGTWYSSNPGSIALGNSSNPVVDYVSGDLTLSGNPTGYGILYVTGTLILGGNFSWYGPIYVIGQGAIEFNGSGNGQIVGSVLTAVTRTAPYGSGNVIPDSTGLGVPSVTSNGGGDAGIQYDHCWSDNLIARIPFTPPMTTDPLTIVSVKSLPY